jgi:hypothetical protein
MLIGSILFSVASVTTSKICCKNGLRSTLPASFVYACFFLSFNFSGYSGIGSGTVLIGCMRCGEICRIMSGERIGCGGCIGRTPLAYI